MVRAAMSVDKARTNEPGGLLARDAQCMEEDIMVLNTLENAPYDYESYDNGDYSHDPGSFQWLMP